MAGMVDGVNKLFLIALPGGSFSVEGFRDYDELVRAVLYRAVIRSPVDVKTYLNLRVEEVLTQIEAENQEQESYEDEE